MDRIKQASIINHLIGPLSKPIYVLRMSGDRMALPTLCHWVAVLHAYASEVVVRCETWLEENDA